MKRGSIMQKEPLIKFIKANIPHISINDVAVANIAENFDEMSFEKGEYLLKQGKISGYFYLAQGYMRAYTYSDLGDEVTTYFYPHNRVIFEAASFFQGAKSNENIQAISACKGYYTTFEKLNAMFHSIPEFREFGRAVLVKEFVEYKQRTLSMINKSAEERYAELMQNSADIFQYAHLRHIASFLGITDTSLSRIRRGYFKKQG